MSLLQNRRFTEMNNNFHYKTFSAGTSLTSIDIENFIEMGLRIIRFNLTNLTRNDKIMLLAKFKQAMKSFCEKYNVPNWPIAISIDLPNACIKTGCFVDVGNIIEI